MYMPYRENANEGRKSSSDALTWHQDGNSSWLGYTQRNAEYTYIQSYLRIFWCYTVTYLNIYFSVLWIFHLTFIAYLCTSIHAPIYFLTDNCLSVCPVFLCSISWPYAACPFFLFIFLFFLFPSPPLVNKKWAETELISVMMHDIKLLG